MTKHIALLGNPNVGKTVIFNELTGAKQHVGNWPGVTVEKKEGRLHIEGTEYHVVDLPGSYSLTAHAEDEKVARDFIIREKPDLVVDIVDASNLERNLYLTSLLLETHTNTIVALNMMDVARDKGFEINIKRLSKLLGVPIIPTIATQKTGLKKLREEIKKNAENPEREKRVHYGKKIEQTVCELCKTLEKDKKLSEKYDPDWLALRILEKDRQAKQIIANAGKKQTINKKLAEITENLDDDSEILLADSRYETLAKIVEKTLKRKKIPEITFTDMLDKVLLDKKLAIPIFLSLMWAVFQFTFTVSNPLMSLIAVFFTIIGDALRPNISDPWLASFLIDGIIGGWGFILTFIPPILFLFFALSVLEDSGYMARAAFMMDKIMYRLGLHGRSFIPILMGFGCNVPAIMAARSIESEKDRLITILINPLISCSARLPVYVLIGGAFFGAAASTAIFSMYLLGIILAIIMARVLRRFIVPGKPAPFLLEIPTYQRPTLKSSLLHMWEKGVVFLKKAGSILLIGSITIWFVSAHPWGVGSIGDSYAGQIGKTIQPILSPLGFDWRATVALITGFVAKETVVATFGILYGAEEETQIQSALRSSMTPLTAYAYMAFVLIYTPCLATVGIIKKETGSGKYAAFSVAYALTLAYIVSYAIISLGHLAGIA